MIKSLVLRCPRLPRCPCTQQCSSWWTGRPWQISPQSQSVQPSARIPMLVTSASEVTTNMATPGPISLVVCSRCNLTASTPVSGSIIPFMSIPLCLFTGLVGHPGDTFGDNLLHPERGGQPTVLCGLRPYHFLLRVGLLRATVVNFAFTPIHAPNMSLHVVIQLWAVTRHFLPFLYIFTQRREMRFLSDAKYNY